MLETTKSKNRGGLDYRRRLDKRDLGRDGNLGVPAAASTAEITENKGQKDQNQENPTPLSMLDCCLPFTDPPFIDLPQASAFR